MTKPSDCRSDDLLENGLHTPDQEESSKKSTLADSTSRDDPGSSFHNSASSTSDMAFSTVVGSGGSSEFTLNGSRRGDNSTITGDGRYHSSDFTLSSTSGTFRSSIKSTTPQQNWPHQPSIRKNNNLDGFTINQLNFSNKIDLYGRDREVARLHKALVDASNEKQLVLLSGYSGVGKSALAKTLKRAVRKLNGLYLEGKFDLQSRNNEPYSAWAALTGAICAHILQQDSHGNSMTLETVVASLEDNLGSELGILVRVFPVLEELFGDRDSIANSKHSTQSGEEGTSSAAQNPLDAKHRLIYAYCRFIRVISSFCHPLVLILDDLQWSDGPSLDLLEALLTDHQETNNPLLFVGIYRSNEVDDTHMLSTNLRDWRARAAVEAVAENSEEQLVEYRHQRRRPFAMQEITVANLQFEAVHEFVNSVLSTSDTDTLGLAELCYSRTHGNIFFLIHFLKLLHRDQMLQFNFGSFKWTWDEKEIQEKTVASENVVDLLLQKMQALTPEQSEAIRMAACLGASFSIDTLALLWRHRRSQQHFDGVETSPDAVQEPQTVTELLDSLIDEGYIQKTDDRKCNFSHDKIEEAASLLQQSGEPAAEFHKWVGQVLLVNLLPMELESEIFIVVNLLNEGNGPTDSEGKIELARLNLRAGTKAMAASAFGAASEYISRGLLLLQPDPWGHGEKDLVLDLFSTGAEAESCLGNADLMETYCQAVMSRKDIAIECKLRVYTTWLASLGNRGHMKEAAEESLRLLAKFGVRFPRSRLSQTVRLVINIMKAKRGLKKNMLEKIPKLPIEKDPTRIKLLHLMDRLSVYLFISHDDLMPLVMFRNFQWTFEYGTNDVTPAALTTLGIIFAGILGDLQAGAAFAKTALKLIPAVSPLVEGRTLFVAHGFGVVWTQPMRDQLKPLLRAYETGLCAGDTESACWAIHLFYHSRFLTSFSLDLCIADIEVYMPQMKKLNQVVAYRSTVVNYQMFMNLAGRTDADPLSLVGEFCTPEDHAEWLQVDPFYEHHCRIWDCYVRTLYGEHEECAKLAVKFGPNCVVKSNPGTFCMSMYEVVCKGISSFVAARKTRKRSYKKIALAIRKRVKNWIDRGNPNVAHLDAFFDAELAAFRGRTYAAIERYKVAIVMAARGGLLLDAGLFSEIFGGFLLGIGEKDDAVFSLQDAVKYYREFGARLKVRILENKYRDLWPKPRMVMTVDGSRPLY